MLVKALQSAVFQRSRRERRRHASPLPPARPALRVVQPVDWFAAYPCTRMHGADFEAEFYKVNGEG